MLQALGGKLISKDMAMRELPFNVNVTLEQEKIEIEDMRTSLLGSLNAYTQAIPQMAAAGQDPSDIVEKIANVIKARQKGMAIEDAILDIFEKPEQVPSTGAPSEVEQPSTAPTAPVGGSPEEPVAPEANIPMQQAPAERPPLESILSSLGIGGQIGGSVRTVARR